MSTLLVSVTAARRLSWPNVKTLQRIERGVSFAAQALKRGIDFFMGEIAKGLCDLRTRNSAPAVYPGSVYVSDGGLLSYGADATDVFCRAAASVDRILRRVVAHADAGERQAKVAAAFTGFITDPDGTVGGQSGTNTSPLPLKAAVLFTCHLTIAAGVGNDAAH